MNPNASLSVAETPSARGRWLVFASGIECGHETWSEHRVLARDGTRGVERRGEQVLHAPHPFPSALTWVARAGEDARVLALELRWSVGERVVRAEHVAEGERWRATLETGGHVRAQQGDYPPACVVALGTHGVHAWMFRRVALEPGAEHVLPALVVGPPWMAVEPGRQIVRCTRAEERDTPAGRVRARFVEVHDPERSEAAWSAWLDPDDEVIESFEDLAGTAPWMRRVEWERGGAAAPEHPRP